MLEANVVRQKNNALRSNAPFNDAACRKDHCLIEKLFG
jgi:hypothetical protein